MQQLAENPFDFPSKYRNIILENNFLNFEKKQFSGKSLACIFLTRFCSVGCSFCFYQSAPPWRKTNIEDQFIDIGMQKFIEFAEKANLGYLLVSGGGEPMTQRKHILQLVEYTKTDRIVLVTSGNWAKNFETAHKYVNDIHEAILKRANPITVVLRISVSTYHCSKLGYTPVQNLIEIFRKFYPQNDHLKLQIKTFENDNSLQQALKDMEEVNYSMENEVKFNISDNNTIIKKIPKKLSIKCNNGLKINVGVSKVFYSTLQANLHNSDFVRKSIQVFEEDLIQSEDDNPAVVFNQNGPSGIDWSINYNGDICTWQNQVRDNYMNLYVDGYDKIWSATLNDPITYSLIDKGRHYRENIINEINPKAVIRMKSIALRDTSGAILFEEEHTRLYFAIRVLQDYLAENKINSQDLQLWPTKIKALTTLKSSELISLYKKSSYSILKQQQLKKFDRQEWLDLLYLVKLGHYDLTQDQIQEGIDYFAQNDSTIELKNINQVPEPQNDDIERRLTERLMHIKPIGNLAF